MAGDWVLPESDGIADRLGLDRAAGTEGWDD